MSDTKILKPDFTGKNPDNLITESIAVTDTNLEYLRPTFTPFYSDSMVITDSKGQILKSGTDYTFIDLIIPLSEKSGLEIHSFIKVLNLNVLSNSPLTYKYQAFGINHPNGTQLDLDTLKASNGVAIDFNDIKGLPKTFPAKPHVHDVTTETAGWDNLIEVINLLYSFRMTRSKQMYRELKTVNDNFWVNVNNLVVNMPNIVWSHTRNYGNAHNLKPSDVLLGNVENTKTGTIAEQLLGNSDTLVTAEGAKAIAENTTNYDSTLYSAGSLPFSYYGNNGFLKPNITGDIGGLGFGCAASLFVREVDGEIYGLLSRYNGNDRGLFFYSLKDDGLYPNNERYTHPVIEAKGDVVVKMVPGSTKEYAGFLTDKNERAYLVEMNGTLDPASHVVAEVDLSPLVDQFAAINDNYPNEKQTVVDYLNMIVGDAYVYIFLFVRDRTKNFSVTSAKTYRFAKADLVSGAKVNFELVMFTYTPVGGSAVTSTDGSLAFIGKATSNNLVTQYGPKFSPGLDDVRTMQLPVLLQGRINDDSTQTKIQFITSADLYFNGGYQTAYLGYVFTLDETALTFTPDSYTDVTFDYTDQDIGTLGPNYTLYQSFLKDGLGNNTTVLSDGTVVFLSANKGQVSLITGWGDNPFSVAGILPSLFIVGDLTTEKYNVAQNYSGFNYHNPNSISYDSEGSYFQAMVDGKMQYFFNYTQGVFVQNDNTKNENVTNGYGLSKIGQTYKVSNIALTPRTTLFQLSEGEAISDGDTRWNAFSYASDASKAFDYDDLTDVTVNNHMVKTLSGDSLTLAGDGSYSYWGAAVISDLLQWLTNGVTPESFGLEVFFAPNSGFLDASGDEIDMPVFVNLMYTNSDHIVKHVYGICKATVVIEDSSITDLPSYRVINVDLSSKSIYIDGPFMVNNGALKLTKSDGTTANLAIGRIRATAVVPSPVVLAVEYMDFPVDITDDNGNEYELEIDTFQSSAEVQSGQSTIKVVTDNPLINRFGFVDFDMTSDMKGASILTIMLGIDKKDISFYLRSAMNVTDKSSQQKLYTFVRHVMDVSIGPGQGISGEAYRAVYGEELDSLDELTALPGVGEVDLSSPYHLTGLTGIFGIQGINGYWANSMNLSNNWTIFFNETVRVVMSGSSYSLLQTSIDISAQFKTYTNTTFYVYVIIKGGKAQYLVTPYKFPTNNHLLFIGTVVTGAAGITSVDIIETFMVNDHLISTTPRGNAVPAVDGLPTEVKNINWY